MSVYILQLILKKYNLFADFKQYGLGEKVVCSFQNSSLGNPPDL